MQLTRTLGFWETVCKYGHDYFSGTGNIVSIAHVQGDLELEKIITILELLMQKHPLLRARIIEKHYKLFFSIDVAFDSIPITTLNNTGKEIWRAVVEHQMNKQFIINKYLWRVVILHSNNPDADHQLIITYHHAIADGLSAAHLIRELLSLYSHQTDDVLNGAIEPLPLNPPIEKCLGQQNTWEAFLLHKTELKANKIDDWLYQKFVPLANRKTRNIYRKLTAHELGQLRNQCRSRQVTVNSALNAAMLLTARMMRDKDISISLHTPVNLRDYCSPKLTTEHLGCYISMVTTTHQCIKKTMDFWQLAKAYHEQLQQSIPKIGFCPAEFSVGDFDIRGLTDLFDMPGSTKRKHYSGGFGVTNLGHLDFPYRYGKLNLDSFMFCTNREMGDFVIFLNVASMHAKMFMAFSYTEPLISHEWAEEFVERYLQILNERICQLDA